MEANGGDMSTCCRAYILQETRSEGTTREQKHRFQQHYQLLQHDQR